MDNPRTNYQMLEGNILAIIDSSGIRDARDVHEDRLSFLEAIRTASLVSAYPFPPTWKMFDAIFHILRDSKSLELTLASFQLLTDLDKCYPRVYLNEPVSPRSNSSEGMELVTSKEAWSPFIVGSDYFYSEVSGPFHGQEGRLNSESFSILVEEIALCRHSADKTVEKMLLFQYLVHALEADFLPRQTLSTDTLNWAFLRESILSMLLASRKMNYKSFVRNCMSITSRSFFHATDSCLKVLKDRESTSAGPPQSCNAGLFLSFPEIQRKTCDAAQKLLILVMELDMIRKEAEKFGLTSRSDGFRVPILEAILDELTYNKDQISSFLEVFSEPKWKLEIILLYFGKYYSMPSTCTRRTNDSPNNETFQVILNCFSNPTISRGILRKINSPAVRLLLAHAFKCYLSLYHDQKNTVFFAKRIGGSTMLQICNSLITSFKNIRKLDESLDLTSFEKEAIFTAISLASKEP